MSISTTWTVHYVDRDMSDDFVYNARWYARANVSGITSYFAEATGYVGFGTRPSSMADYDTLSEATVLGWCKNELGNTEVLKIEENLGKQLAKGNTGRILHSSYKQPDGISTFSAARACPWKKKALGKMGTD